MIGIVPCNGCTLCCIGDTIRLLPQDKGEYQTELCPIGGLMLAHKEDGSCVYMAESGCGIHNRRPTICREFDCRSMARVISFDQAMIMHAKGILDMKMWDKGQDLLKETKNG